MPTPTTKWLASKAHISIKAMGSKANGLMEEGIHGQHDYFNH
jgi:hypothetical protein